MSGGVPANTTTTTTVNQSPWQNPTYQALMLGTKDNPGPITNILRSNAGYMNAYNNMLGKGITPMDVVNSGKYNPTVGGAGSSFQEAAPAQAAASGGIMNARGYAPGGKVQNLSTAQLQAVTKYNNLIAKGETPPSALVNQLNRIEKNTGRNVSPYVDSGTAAVGNAKLQDLIAKAAGSGNYPKGTGTSPYDSISSAYPQSGAVQQYTDAQKQADEKTKTADAQQRILEQSLGQTAFVQKVKNPDGTYRLESTNPLFNQAVNRVLDAQQMPEQFGQATNAYNQAISGLQGMTNYQPQQVASRDVTGATMQGREAKAAQINRSDVRDINAIMADVERYQAAGMQAPPALRAEAYEAAQMQGAQLQGPKSWTDPGTAQKYMSPYQQAVTDQAKYEAQRDYLQNLNSLRGGAAKSKAYGGARQALQEGEAMRGQLRNLANIEAQGLNEAYKSGMGQFSAEQGLGLQAGQSNLQAALTTQQQNQQALNQQRSLYVQQALDAAKTSYGGELTAAQANQVAANAASQFNAGAQNLAYNNYVQQQLAAQQANQAQDWNVANQNAQLAQQAELANQQYGLGGFQSNLNNAQFSQQANLANQNAALQAAQANQQAGLTANQQNLGAYGQLFQGAQGLGALGASQASTNLANIGALGQAASAWQNLGQQYLNTQTDNARNTMNLPSNLYSGALNAINAQPSTGGSTTATGTSSPASWMGRAEGGEVEAHKEWDKAKGGKTAKTGIASKGWN